MKRTSLLMSIGNLETLTPSARTTTHEHVRSVQKVSGTPTFTKGGKLHPYTGKSLEACSEQQCDAQKRCDLTCEAAGARKAQHEASVQRLTCLGAPDACESLQAPAAFRILGSLGMSMTILLVLGAHAFRHNAAVQLKSAVSEKL